MLILKNCLAVQFDPPDIKENIDIVIKDDKIIDTGTGISKNHRGSRIINLNGNMVTTGLVCSHNHFYSALARGITSNIRPSTDFVSVLNNLWWRLDRVIDKDILYYSGITGALDAIKAGTTSVIDHHASPSFIKGSLNILKAAFEKAGLRGILCYEVTDRNGEKGMREGIEESIDFADSIDKDKKADNLIQAAIGGHAPFTLSDRSLSLLSEAVKLTGKGLHIHVAEDRYDPAYSHHLYQKDNIERLDDFKLINNKTICVHGVYLTDNDIGILNKKDSFLIHNPRSNMNNGVGYNSKLNSVKNLALGTDGIGSNMFEELKTAYFKHKDTAGHLWPDAFLKYLNNGNILLERYFSKKFGKIHKGYQADLVIYDYNSPTPLVTENIAGHFVFGLSSRDVNTVIINGRIVYENRAFPFDIKPIYNKAQDAASRMWDLIDNLK